MNKLLTPIVFVFLFLLGCTGPGLGTPDLTGFKGHEGTVALRTDSQFRTLNPSTNLTLGNLDVVFTKDSLQINKSTTIDSALSVSLAPGLWFIEINAYNTDTPGVLVAQGSGSVTVTAGETSSAFLTLVPVQGVGTLSLTASFGGTSLVSPRFTGTLTSPSGGGTINLPFETSVSSSTSMVTNIPTGFYLLTVVLSEGSTLLGKSVEAVRILANQVTNGSLVLTSGGGAGEGSLGIQITTYLGLPAEISFTGLNNQIQVGSTPTVTAQASVPQDSWTWYLDGIKLPGKNAFYTLSADLPLGTHRLDAMGKAGDLWSSNFLVFQVVQTPLAHSVWADWPGKSNQNYKFTDSLEVILSAQNPATGEYSLDTGGRIAYTSGETLSLGQGLAPGASVILTLYGGEAPESLTFTKKLTTTTFDLHYYSPAGVPYIWAWEGGDAGRAIMGLEGFEWNTNHPQMTAEGEGWYVWTVPAKYLPLTAPLNFKINKNDPTYSRSASGWYDGSTWKDSDPRTLMVSLSPASGSFSADTDVNISVTGPGSATATVSAALEGIPLTLSNGKVNLKATTWVEGVEKTLSVTATSGAKSVTTTGKYTYNTTVVSGDPMDLRLYQVMVEAYQDGDSSRDYNTGYGPSNHKGDIRGIINALPYIKSLGVNALWMTPIFNSDGSGPLDATGYFCKDYFTIDPKFGSLADAQELVDKAHAAGLYVFFDGVFGHHKSGVVASPSGKTPQGGNDPVDYTNPQTLEFYKEVATYWINTLGIDGWRLDQAYQVPVSAWMSIREAVEATSLARKNAGKTWGTLGYMVGEIWKGETEIASQGYGATNQGLKSNFDFPFRYRIVQTLATQEETAQAGAYNAPASNLAGGYASHSAYPTGAQPNLMLTNHDLVRFGDLIQRAPNLGYGPENGDYWKRHKLALGLMASYSGPITLYYGDEYGAEVGGFVKKGDGGFYDDHVSRDNGRISGFNGNEQDLINFVKALMTLRSQNESLYKGTRTNLLSTATLYADKKEGLGTDFVVILNTSTTAQSATLTNVGGTGLTDAITGEVISGSGSYTVPMGSLGFRLLKIN